VPAARTVGKAAPCNRTQSEIKTLKKKYYANEKKAGAATGEKNLWEGTALKEL